MGKVISEQRLTEVMSEVSGAKNAIAKITAFLSNPQAILDNLKASGYKGDALPDKDTALEFALSDVMLGKKYLSLGKTKEKVEAIKTPLIKSINAVREMVELANAKKVTEASRVTGFAVVLRGGIKIVKA
jgi:hypothetical protein